MGNNKFQGTCPKCGYNKEKEILDLYSKGLSREQIAEKLELTAHTVRYHTAHLPNNGIDRRKMKVSPKTKEKIIKLAEQGVRKKEIASQLGLAYHTIVYHTQHLVKEPRQVERKIAECGDSNETDQKRSGRINRTNNL